MDIFYSAAVLWFIAGFILFLLEFVVPGLILFFFAISAWIVAVLLLFVDMPINTQLIIFLSGAILTILLLRKWVRKLVRSRKLPTELEDEFLGKTGRAETLIGPGIDGKVYFKGTSWDARSTDMIQPGENVVIIGNESILLLVQSVKTIA